MEEGRHNELRSRRSSAFVIVERSGARVTEGRMAQQQQQLAALPLPPKKIPRRSAAEPAEVAAPAEAAEPAEAAAPEAAASRAGGGGDSSTGADPDIGGGGDTARRRVARGAAQRAARPHGAQRRHCHRRPLRWSARCRPPQIGRLSWAPSSWSPSRRTSSGARAASSSRAKQASRGRHRAASRCGWRRGRVRGGGLRAAATSCAAARAC